MRPEAAESRNFAVPQDHLYLDTPQDGSISFISVNVLHNCYLYVTAWPWRLMVLNSVFNPLIFFNNNDVRKEIIIIM
jgi:hypothetical protein